MQITARCAPRLHVAHQVEQNLLNLDPVGQDQFGCRIEFVATRISAIFADQS
jgi:hypothetical protein